VLGSVCDASYANSLTAIQQKIIELGTQFYLDGSPVPDSIRVVVDGTMVPNATSNGWTFNSAANSIVFHGTAVPPAGASINVTFDPAKLTF
jgi:archaellum component FlaF (FlaF/FlaG flagellin family)